MHPSCTRGGLSRIAGASHRSASYCNGWSVPSLQTVIGQDLFPMLIQVSGRRIARRSGGEALPVHSHVQARKLWCQNHTRFMGLQGLCFRTHHALQHISREFSDQDIPHQEYSRIPRRLIEVPIASVPPIWGSAGNPWDTVHPHEGKLKCVSHSALSRP